MLIARRLAESSPAARRTLLPLVLAGGFAGVEFIVLRAASLTDWTQAFGVLNWIDLANLVVVPTAILVGLATIRRHRGPLGDLVVELRAARPDQIEPALARAVGRPVARARAVATGGAALRRLRRRAVGREG